MIHLDIPLCKRDSGLKAFLQFLTLCGPWSVSEASTRILTHSQRSAWFTCKADKVYLLLLLSSIRCEPMMKSYKMAPLRSVSDSLQGRSHIHVFFFKILSHVLHPIYLPSFNYEIISHSSTALLSKSCFGIWVAAGVKLPVEGVVGVVWGTWWSPQSTSDQCMTPEPNNSNKTEQLCNQTYMYIVNIC